MKILIYSCSFEPEPIGVGKFAGETASWLALSGHDVRVVCAPPSYPHRKIADGYSGAWYSREISNGVDIRRSPLWVSREQSGLGRVLQYLSFSLFSAPSVLWSCITWKPDIVLTIIPPTSVILVAVVAAKLVRASTWLHVQDFDIDAAFELNILNSRYLRSPLLWFERWLMSRNHIVSSITPRMLDRLRAKKVKATSLEFPNWADLENIYPIEFPNPLRSELGIPENAFIALYSGNLGQKQGVDVLIDVARLLSAYPRIRVVIGGDGASRERLATIVGGQSNIHLIDLQPLSRLNLLLNLADVHLLPQKIGVADLVMPSKLGGMLASGRPVVVGAAPGTQLAQEVDECGIAVAPDDASAMAAALVSLYKDDAERKRLGVAARQRALLRWDKSAVLSAFEKRLVELHETNTVSKD